jgi:hypothetical protein
MALKPDILDAYLRSINNNIKQRSAEWHNAKKYTIGGSQLSSFDGSNVHATINDVIAHKFGYDDKDALKSRLPMNWGVLFEDVIKTYIEMTLNTTVFGDDLFITGPSEFISYSPDGLGVVSDSNNSINNSSNHSDKIVLFEFKCPYTRIPTSKPPKYYVPQVKMGLDIIPIADEGMLIEAVFRRCSWADMGANLKFDKLITEKKSGSSLLACGVVGFYFDDMAFSKKITELRLVGRDTTADTLINKLTDLNKEYKKFFTIGSTTNNYATNDLGACQLGLFERLLECFSEGVLNVWYSKIIQQCDNDNVCKHLLNTEFATYECLCAALGEMKISLSEDSPKNNIYNYGILPWKLFNVKSHIIEKTQDYLLPWIDKINSLMSEIKNSDQMSPQSRRRKYEELTAPKYEIIE